jgi:uncharacterized protein (DUF58 family)
MADHLATYQLLKPRNTLVFCATTCLMVGIVARNPQLMALGGLALGAILVAFWEARRLLSSVSVERTHHGRAFEGGPLEVSLRIASPDRSAPELLHMEDRFPPGNTSTISTLLPDPPHGNQAVDFHYQGSCDHRRGLYLLGPVSLRATDSLGLFTREATLEHMTELIVFPLSVELHRQGLLAEGVRRHVGMETSRRAGHGEEFLGLRDFQSGDPLSRIHWLSTARHGRLMTREFQENLTTLVTLALDLSKLGLAGLGDQTSVEYLIKATASLAREANELTHSFQFYGFGQAVHHLPPGSGTGHLLTLLDRLAFVRADGDRSLGAELIPMVPTLPRGSTLVALQSATAVRVEEWMQGLAIASARRIRVILVLVDDRGFLKLFREQEIQHFRSAPLEEVSEVLRLQGAVVRIIRRGKNVPQALIDSLAAAP